MEITLQTIYYTFGIIAALCGAAYTIGYQMGKNAKKVTVRA